MRERVTGVRESARLLARTNLSADFFVCFVCRHASFLLVSAGIVVLCVVSVVRGVVLR